MTPEEFRNDYAKKQGYLNWNDLSEDLWIKGWAMNKAENTVATLKKGVALQKPNIQE